MTDELDEGFEEIPHTSDVAIRVWGRDLADLFANAARGMAWLMVDPRSVNPTVEVSLELSARDVETLLVTWLGELLYLGERDGLVFTVFALDEITPTHLRGKACGGAAGDTRRYIKAVTFSEMEIQYRGRGVETIVVFDV
jgi:SHS2 domain-containing protein